MKIFHKLIAGLLGYALLVGVVGYYGLSASKQIAEFFEEGDKNFKVIVTAATEVSSHAKRAESHLMLYLALHREADKRKFPKIVEALQAQISILDKNVKLPQGRALLGRLKSKVDEMLPIGNALIEAHDKAMEKTGGFDQKEQQELILKLHKVAATARKYGVELTRLETDFLNKQASIAAATEVSSHAKRAESHLMLYLAFKREVDKQKFAKRITELQEQISILGRRLKTPESRSILEKIKPKFSEVLPIANTLLEAHDKAMEKAGKFDPKEHENLMLKLHDVFSAIRKHGVELAKLGINSRSKAKAMAIADATRLQHNILIVVLSGVISALILGYALSRTIANPIIKLKNAASEIGRGNLEAKIEIQSKDEIGDLGRSFEHMRVSLLHDTIKRIRTEEKLKTTAENLRQKADELERSNRELDQFAYVTSHDLKAPLRAIANLSQWIEEDIGEQLEGDTRKQMDLLRGRVNRMEDLIEGILQYSRLGRVAVDIETVDVGELLAETIDTLAPPEGFIIEVGSDMPILETAKIRLSQVFANLISNAIKYHDREDGHIQVSVTDAGEFYEFTVADDGPGIAPEYHDKVFQIFQTLIAKDTRESTGVGLTLVKKIVEDQGGTIELESETGQGADFRFTWLKSRRDL